LLIDDTGIRDKVQKLEERRERGDLPSMNGNLQAKIPMRKDSNEFKELEKHFNDEFGDQVQIVNDEAFWTDNLVRDVYAGKRAKARLGLPSDALLKLMAGKIPQSDIDAFAAMSPAFSKAVFEQHAVKHLGEKEKRWTNIPLANGDFDLLPWVWRAPNKVIPVKNHHIVLEFETLDGNYLQMSMSTMRGFSSFYKTKMPLEATPGFTPFDPFKI
jgi:hypothetical protein